MRLILQKISKLAFECHGYEFDYSLEQFETNWIGFSPAKDEEIEKKEKELQIKLPEEYIHFLKITNGFSQSEITEPEFFPINKIDWFKNTNPELIKTWKETGNIDSGLQLERSILIADSFGEQQFLLVPPLENKKWEFWKFATWIPGEEKFDSLTSYFKEVLDFLMTIKKGLN